MVKTIIVSGADAKYFHLLQDMITSSHAAREQHGAALGVLDFGLAPEHLAWLRSRDARIVSMGEIIAVLPEAMHRLEFLPYAARAMLADLFPGFSLLIWLDADLWLQDDGALDAFVAGADTAGLAMVAERHQGYRFQAWLQAWIAKHFLAGYGPVRGLWLFTRPHLNVGAFAMQAGAPHWAQWRHAFAAAFRRSGRAIPHDQFALNQIVHQHHATVQILPAPWNWICDRGPPVWDGARGCFCTPDPSREPIRIMHLAGPAKDTTYRLRRSDGGTVETGLRMADYVRLRQSA